MNKKLNMLVSAIIILACASLTDAQQPKKVLCVCHLGNTPLQDTKPFLDRACCLAPHAFP